MTTTKKVTLVYHVTGENITDAEAIRAAREAMHATWKVETEGEPGHRWVYPKPVADSGTIEEFARSAHMSLDNFPEFGDETQQAIIDTAADALTDAGYLYDRAELRRIALRLA